MEQVYKAKGTMRGQLLTQVSIQQFKVTVLFSLKQAAYLHRAEHSVGIQVINENLCHFIN